MMNTNEFDARLKSTLENLEPPYDPTTWTALESRMNRLESDEVDKVVGSVLQQLEVPYQASHWQLLADRLVAQRALRRRLWTAKIAEAALVLLLLAQLDGLLTHRSALPEFPQTPVKSNRPVAEQLDTEKGETSVKGYANVYIEQIINGGANGSLLASSVVGSDNPLTATEGTISVIPVIEKQITESAIPDNPLALLPLAEVPFLQTPEQQAYMVGRPVRKFRNAIYFAGLQAGLDQNSFQADKDKRSWNAFSAGIIAGRKLGNWTVESGLLYTHRKFTPRPVVEIYAGNLSQGYYGSALRGVDAHIVKVPAHVTRSILQIGKSSVRAVAGVSAQVAIQKEYIYKEVYYPGSSQTWPPPPPPTKPEFAKNSEGVLQGGRWRGNAYLTADLGLRFEYKIGSRYKVFIAPTYQRAVGGTGISTKPSQIHTLQLQAGVMTNFKLG